MSVRMFSGIPEVFRIPDVFRSPDVFRFTAPI